MLHVGGNDADNGTDIETFAEQYESLLTELMSNNRRVIVSGLLPRKTVDLSLYNDRLKSLCEAYEIDYIDNYGDFLLAAGDIPDSYFMRDKIHLNSYGLKKLLPILTEFIISPVHAKPLWRTGDMVSHSQVLDECMWVRP